jgi:hypothetical protein
VITLHERSRTMLALAEPPPTQPDPVPGLKRSPEWHRAQEDQERAWLDAYMRRALKCSRRPLHGRGGTP